MKLLNRVVLLALSCGTWIWAADGNPPSCTGYSSTVNATVSIQDNVATVNPQPICVAPGGHVTWTFDSSATDLKVFFRARPLGNQQIVSSNSSQQAGPCTSAQCVFGYWLFAKDTTGAWHMSDPHVIVSNGGGMPSHE